MLDPVRRAIAYVRDRSSGDAIPTNFRITLNFHPDSAGIGGSMIELLARDAVYKSQFETGTSNGGQTAYPGGERWNWESRIFGSAYDDCDHSRRALRPKYGALNDLEDPVGAARRFGSCYLRLRHDVRERTTFCYPDSHLQPEHFGVADRMSLIARATAHRSQVDPLDDYIEAHVHGPLRISEDVEAVVLDPSYAGTAVEGAARMMSCALEWHHGFRLGPDRLDDCKRYRGAAAAEVIASMTQCGLLTPKDLGAARLAGLDQKLAKWVWHCMARFGRSS